MRDRYMEVFCATILSNVADNPQEGIALMEMYTATYSPEPEVIQALLNYLKYVGMVK